MRNGAGRDWTIDALIPRRQIMMLALGIWEEHSDQRHQEAGLFV